MAVIKVEDVMGFFVGQECVCADCASKDEEASATLDEIITRDDTESSDLLYFCDRCNGQIG